MKYKVRYYGLGRRCEHDNLFDFDWYKAVYAAAVLDCAVDCVSLARVLRYVTKEET